MNWRRTSKLSLWIVVCAAAALGCNKKEDAGAAPTPPPPSKPQAAADPAPDPAPDETLKEHMQGHFTVVKGIVDAIVHGDLATAKVLAKALAEHQSPDVVEAWSEHLEVMREAANAFAGARDLAAGAELTAKLGGECASCHRNLTAIATFPWVPKPEVEKGDVKSHMAVHKWATDRLWEGLVGPSNSHWEEGAALLVGEPLHEGEIVPGKEVAPDIATLAKRVHELGAEAQAAKEPAERVSVYGRLLATCSSCHGQTR